MDIKNGCFTLVFLMQIKQYEKLIFTNLIFHNFIEIGADPFVSILKLSVHFYPI